MSIREIPILGSLVAVVGDLLLFGGDLLVGLLLSLGELIPILSLASAYVAPQLEWLPTSAISTALFVSALVYMGVSLGRLLGVGDTND